MDTGFRGSHRDAAMPPPSADQASMEDGDPHPCPEDAEFFECRPDTADMEEAIALDVWARQPPNKPSLGGLSVAETAVRKSARHEEQVKRAVETRRRRKAAKASSK